MSVFLHNKRSRGFSMVELLVAVLIMGVGVLGVTGLQMVSLQNNRDALLRSEALQLAYDVIDRMRVNPTVNYNGVGFDDDPTAPPQNCIDGTCAPGQMRTFDVSLWKCSLGKHNEQTVCDDLRDDETLPVATSQPGLPDGEGQIAVNGAGIITVTIRWTAFNGVQETLTIESQG